MYGYTHVIFVCQNQNSIIKLLFYTVFSIHTAGLDLNRFVGLVGSNPLPSMWAFVFSRWAPLRVLTSAQAGERPLLHMRGALHPWFAQQTLASEPSIKGRDGEQRPGGSEHCACAHRTWGSGKRSPSKTHEPLFHPRVPGSDTQ